MSSVRKYVERWLKVDHVLGHTFYAGSLGPECIVIDLGSYKDTFSKYLFEKYGCQCYAIEASPIVFKEMESNTPIRRFNLAIVGQEGPVVLNVLANPQASYVGPEYVGPESEGIVNRLTVDGQSLKAFLKSNEIHEVDLLKVDIEGSEIPLFEQTDDDTLRRLKQITVEFHDFLDRLRGESDRVTKIKKRLKQLGFIPINFSAPRNLDCLFINRKSLRIHPLALFYLFSLASWFNLRRHIWPLE